MNSLSAVDFNRTGEEFLAQTPEYRLQILKSLGLARFAPFLTKLIPSKANLECVLTFLKMPDRVKFPPLRGADLAGLHLEGVNFIRADLTGANLQNCHLENADMLFARLMDADLRGANLLNATLNETIWTGARVEQCIFGKGKGLTTNQRHELAARGAIFSFVEGEVLL
jgi:hypothetical protein